MLNIRYLLLLICLLAFSACEVEEPEAETVNTIDLMGNWISEETDLAIAFEDSLAYIRLEFFIDSTYTQTNGFWSGDSVTYAGSFSIGPKTEDDSIYPIQFDQENPSLAEYKGIIELNALLVPQELSMEAVNSSPLLEYELPEILDGFGSGHWDIAGIQKYKKLP